MDYKFLTSQSLHLKYVFEDIDFINEVYKLAVIDSENVDDWIKPFKVLANKYHIRTSDVYRFKIFGNDLALQYALNTNFSNIIKYNEFSDIIELRLKPNITDSEFRKLFKKIYKIQQSRKLSTNRKRKPPEYPDLIYAIFKERLNNRTFREIYEDYQNTNLKYYLKNNNSFSSEDMLEKYYRKYEPEPLKI